MSKPPLPDFRNYVSPRVFEGIRVLTGVEAEQTRERIKRAFARLKRKAAE